MVAQFFLFKMTSVDHEVASLQKVRPMARTVAEVERHLRAMPNSRAILRDCSFMSVCLYRCLQHIVRLGAKNKEGQYSVKYGVLFKVSRDC